MGRINKIFHPSDWKIIQEGQSKIVKGDIIYQMKIGEGEDYQDYDITELISKENYENIIKGIYTIKVFPYSQVPVLLFDEEKIISLIKGLEVPLENLNSIQQEIVIKNKKYLRK